MTSWGSASRARVNAVGPSSANSTENPTLSRKCLDSAGDAGRFVVRRHQNRDARGPLPTPDRPGTQQRDCAQEQRITHNRIGRGHNHDKQGPLQRPRHSLTPDDRTLRRLLILEPDRPCAAQHELAAGAFTDDPGAAQAANRGAGS